MLYFNLDFPEDKQYFLKQPDFVNYLNLKTGGKNAYVLVDEIQRLENAGLFLKELYDRYLTHKFIVSSSGRLELKEKIHESLIGRKEIITVSTISFLEFLNFKTDYYYQDKLKDFLFMIRIHLFNFFKSIFNSGVIQKWFFLLI